MFRNWFVACPFTPNCSRQGYSHVSVTADSVTIGIIVMCADESCITTGRPLPDNCIEESILDP